MIVRHIYKAALMGHTASRQAAEPRVGGLTGKHHHQKEQAQLDPLSAKHRQDPVSLTSSRSARISLGHTQQGTVFVCSSVLVWGEEGQGLCKDCIFLGRFLLHASPFQSWP